MYQIIMTTEIIVGYYTQLIYDNKLDYIFSIIVK